MLDRWVTVNATWDYIGLDAGKQWERVDQRCLNEGEYRENFQGVLNISGALDVMTSPLDETVRAPMPLKIWVETEQHVAKLL